MQPDFKYTFKRGEVDFLLSVLNKVQLTGVDTARVLVAVTEHLQAPDNAADLEKETLETLKSKYEKKPEEKK